MNALEELLQKECPFEPWQFIDAKIVLDWLWNYGSIGLTKEHIKRLNDVTNILEALNEHTDAKYLKEIQDKLLEVTPEPKIVKINTDAFIEKAVSYIQQHWIWNTKIIEDFRKHMKGE